MPGLVNGSVQLIVTVLSWCFRGEVEVNQPLSPLSHKLTLWHVDQGGKPSRTSFQRLSFNGTTSVIKCKFSTRFLQKVQAQVGMLVFVVFLNILGLLIFRIVCCCITN